MTPKRPRRGDVFWVNLDPTVGTEIRKTRPAVILSNDAQNRAGQRVLAAPITSNASKVYSFEAAIRLSTKPAKVMLDQVRCLDQSRLGNCIGAVSKDEMTGIEKALKTAFDMV